MTSRRWLIKLMKQAAERKNVTFESIRQGGSHEFLRGQYDDIKEAEAKLGKGWYQQ